MLPDEKVRHHVQKWTGYSCSGDTGEQKILIFKGEGRNMKSALFEIFATILGDYAALLPIATRVGDDRKGAGDASPHIARLRGVRFVRTSEPRVNAPLNTSAVKLFTSGEEIEARHLNRGFFEFVPHAKIFMACNRLPRVQGDDEGTWRRLDVVPFSVQLDPNEVDKTFVAKLLKEEKSAIFNWMLVFACGAWTDSMRPVP